MRKFVLVLATVCACSGGSGPPAPPNVTGDPVMTTPFLNRADVASINEAFSTSTNAPWHFAHNGIDFFPSGDLKPFQAVVPGLITSMSLNQNSSTSNWQVNVRIAYNATYSLDYIFEPFSTSQSEGQAQHAHVLVSQGQNVAAGTVIGRVRTAGQGAHLHVGLSKNDVGICPEPFFAPTAGAAILDVIHTTQPSWGMCY